MLVSQQRLAIPNVRCLHWTFDPSGSDHDAVARRRSANTQWRGSTSYKHEDLHRTAPRPQNLVQYTKMPKYKVATYLNTMQ